MSENKHTSLPKTNGMTVPPDFFENFTSKMMERIPAEEPKPQVAEKRTIWQIIRPYVYMAAMFAGIWLMMNMSTFFTPDQPAPATSKALLAEVVNPESVSYVDDYMVASQSDYDFYDDLYNSGFEIPEII